MNYLTNLVIKCKLNMHVLAPGYEYSMLLIVGPELSSITKAILAWHIFGYGFRQSVVGFQ